MTKRHKRVSFRSVAERLEEFEGLTYSEAAQLAGYANKESAKNGFTDFRKRGLISFQVKNRKIYALRLLDPQMIDEVNRQEERAEVAKRLLVLNVERLALSRSIAQNNGNKAKDINEALKRMETAEKTVRQLLGQNVRLTGYAVDLLDHYGITAPDFEGMKKD